MNKIDLCFLCSLILFGCSETPTSALKNAPSSTANADVRLETPGKEIKIDAKKTDAFEIKITEADFPSYGLKEIDNEIYNNYIKDSLDDILAATHDNLLSIFEAEVRRDPVVKGDEKKLAKFGMFTAVTYQIKLRSSLNVALDPWEIDCGRKLYLLLLKVQSFPKEPKYRRMRLALIQGFHDWDISISPDTPDKALQLSLTTFSKFKE